MTGKQYIMSGSNLDGVILFKFNLNGFLTVLEMPELTQEQYTFIFRLFPWNTESMDQLKKFKNITLKEVPADLSFNAFWESYGYKVGKKKMAQNTWGKLSEADQIQAMIYIPKYKDHLLQKGTAQAYASTYLNQRYFDV